MREKGKREKLTSNETYILDKISKICIRGSNYNVSYLYL